MNIKYRGYDDSSYTAVSMINLRNLTTQMSNLINSVLSKNEIENIKKYVRAANYLSAGQIYLQSNFLLKDKLTFDDIKTRLLGHWGTCPGINFTYACVNNLIKKTLPFKPDLLFQYQRQDQPVLQPIRHGLKKIP